MSRDVLVSTASSSVSPVGPKARTGWFDNARAACAAVAAAVMAVVTWTGIALDRMIGAHERWRQRQALMKLEDHLLKDIGLSRADVEKEVSKPIWRR